MGKIYEDVNTENEEVDITKEAFNTFFSVTTTYAERDNILHRDDEIARLDSILNKSSNRSVLLVGDKGCGKTSIIEGYISKMVKEYKQDTVATIDYDRICDIVNSPGEFSTMIDTIVSVACAEDNNIIIHLSGLGHILDRNVYGTGGFTFVNRVVNAIRDLDMRVIATATTDEYNDIRDEFPYILDYFTVIKVTELTKEQTVDIIDTIYDNYEENFNLRLPDNISNLICDNAEKYVKDRPFPEKAEWLLDEVCSKLSLKRGVDPKLIKISKELLDLRNEIGEKLTSKGTYEECKELNDKIENLTKRLLKLKEKQQPTEVIEIDILEAIGDIVGVKMSRLDKNKVSFLQNMPVEIKKSVIGQDEVIDKICKNITRNKLGLRKSAHSMGNFIFIGSTGVGKTHLAKQIARYLYGSEDNLLRFDMSEYQSEIDVSKLLGSAPGYVGYKESGLLVKRLAKYPESVVLFDEIEKAHPKIYDVLLQLLDEGFITGSDGNKVDATKSLIIFTSNVGVRSAKQFSSPIGYSNDMDSVKNKHREDIIRKALNKRFSPEFLNRLDNICYFNNLDRDTLKSILHKEIKDMNENIKTICGKSVELTEEVETWILDKVETEENGARPIIRHLQQNIEEELSTMIIEDNKILKSNKKTLKAYIKNDKIILK